MVLFIALVAIGPKQIPQVAFKLGQWLGYLKNLWHALSAELRQQMQQEIEAKNKEEDSPSNPPQN